MKNQLFFLLISFVLFACQQNPSSEEQNPALSEAEVRLPANALAGLSVGEGLQAQLFAAEPLVRNPSNMDIDHRGRVWVVENVNYRPENNPDNEYQEGGDMIVILEDTDGDGKADDRKVFFQDVLVDGAMGIGVFDNQVYVSSSPHILVLTDEDRDDKADRVDTLFTGLGHKQGDHTVHAVSFGPDGRLYFNFGNSTREVLDKAGRPVRDKMGNIVKSTGVPYQQGMILRCAMDGSELEVLGHNFRNNFEVCVDSYGRMWQSDNDDDGHQSVRINYVMEYGNYGYRDELTQAAWQVSRSGMHEDIPAQHWHQNDPGVIPNLLITGSGSPCGITMYEGTLLPPAFQGQLMHADAGPGTLQAYLIKDKGAGFSAEIEPMLMREADAWYRPTDVTVAPDGSVLAADWYDPGVGGHWAGDALRGRIYRIAPDVSQYTLSLPDFSSPEGVAKALKSPNAATRFLAWKVLSQATDGAEVALLTLWDSDDPLYRARALWLLARMDKTYLEKALQDTEERIRATAIRVARQLYPTEILPLLKKAVDDPSSKVRREAAIALRELNAAEKAKIWSRLALQYDGQDRWYLEALGIGAMGAWEACFSAWKAAVGEQWDTKVGRDIVWRSRAKETMAHLITLLEKPGPSAQEQARYLRATDFVTAANKDELLTSLINIKRTDQLAFQQMLLSHISADYAKESTAVKQALQQLLPTLEGTAAYLGLVDKLALASESDKLYQLVQDKPNHELGVRAAQLLVKLKGWDVFKEAIQKEDKEAVLKVLKHINQKESKALLSGVILDDKEVLETRRLALESLAWDWGWEGRVIALLEKQTLPDELVTAAANKLLSAARPVDRAKGMEYLDEQETTAQALPTIQALLQEEGDIDEGQMVFATYCLSCHQVGEQGIDFGPNLSEVGNKLGKDALLGAIIYPDAAISHGFEGMQLTLRDGTKYQGYILSENDQEVLLKIVTGSAATLSKADITAIEPMKNSLMTTGLAQAMGEKDLVHLVSYLSSLSNQKTMASNPFQGQIGYDRAQK